MAVLKIKMGDIWIEKGEDWPFETGAVPATETWSFTLTDDTVVEKEVQVFADGD